LAERTLAFIKVNKQIGLKVIPKI